VCEACGASMGRFDVRCPSCASPLVPKSFRQQIRDTGDPDDIAALDAEEQPPEAYRRTPVTAAGVAKLIAIVPIVAVAEGVGGVIGYDLENWRAQDNIRRGIERSR